MAIGATPVLRPGLEVTPMLFLPLTLLRAQVVTSALFDAVTGQLAAELTVLKRLVVRRWPRSTRNRTA